jgi:hypothetical protein
MRLVFPPNITDKKDKYSFAIRVIELLRIEFNQKGRQYRDGKITQQEWDTYRELHEQKENAAIEEALKYKQQIEKDSTILNDLTGVFE